LIHDGEISHHLETFKGTWRRLEYKGNKQNCIYFDDYAHHPTEIKSSLLALRQEYPERKIICVFEPHQQSRTKALFEGFVEALQIADRCFIAPILCVREQYDPEITNEKLSKAVSKFVPSTAVETPEELMGEMKKLDPTLEYCVVLMGAGNIYKWTETIMK
jgi:UDP-N-acetylmuramate--alanine ligase